MGAVTPDASAAAGRIGKQYLTSFGVAMFVSPLKWVFILAPLVMVFAISFGINRLKPATAQLLFWVFAALMGISLSSIFLVYTHHLDRAGVLHHSCLVRCAEPLRLHHQA